MLLSTGATLSLVSVTGIVFTLLLSVGVPIALLLLWRKKAPQPFRAATIGALCFIVFAMILEQLLHALIIPQIIGTPWLYAVYGCLAAGLFEETGRLVGLKWLCKRDASFNTGFLYGIGHGGIESILVVGLASVSNLALIFSLSRGAIENITMQQAADVMVSTPPYYFWLSGLERVIAIALHLALSILIWMVVTKRIHFAFYFVSIGLHALINTSAALMQTGILTNVIVVEVITAVVCAAICVFVAWLYRHSAAAVSSAQPAESETPTVGEA